MRVDVQELTGIVTNNIKSIVEMNMQNKVSSLLFHFEDERLCIRYSDGKSSIEVRMPVEYEDDDIKTDVALSYKELSDALSRITGGKLKTGVCEMKFEEGTVTMRVNKYVDFEGVDGAVSKTVSKIKQEIGWASPDSSMKYKLLTRMDYEEMFNSDGDEWDTAEIKNIFNKLSLEKSKSVSISSQSNMAFVNTFSFASIIPVENANSSLILSYKAAKALVTILGRVDAERVIVTKTGDDKFINITDGETIGVQFEAGAVSKVDISAVARYYETEYNDYRFKFYKDSLAEVVNIVSQEDKIDKHTIKFREDDGDVVMVIPTKSNEYTVSVMGKIPNKEEALALEIPISIKIINDMLSLCDEEYVSMFMCRDEERILLRIGDIDMSNTTGADDIAHKILTYTIC